MGCILNMNIMVFRINGEEEKASEVNVTDVPVREYKDFKSSRQGS